MCEIKNYDKWKLSNNIDEQRNIYMSNEVEQEPEKLGYCPCCEELVREDQLYVVEMEHGEEVFYHFSCYNYEQAEKRRVR